MNANSQTETQRTALDQRGVVAIFTTLVMMIVISLIVLGFAQASRRNQREALDHQLSTQAFYAAESGINAAAHFLANNPTYATDTLSTQDCNSFRSSAIMNSTGAISPAPNTAAAAYSCLMVNPTPLTLSKAPLSQDTSTIWNVQSTGGNFTSLTFKWSGHVTNPPLSTSGCNHPTFPAYTSWNCAYGIVRVDLVDVTGGLNAATLNNPNNNITLYLVPNVTTAGHISAMLAPPGTPGSPNATQVIQSKCTTTGNGCSIILNLGARSSGHFYARLIALYQSSDDVQLTGATAVGAAKFQDGQAIIDSTGQAQDEFRRIQVTIPLTRAPLSIPNYALQTTQAICKQLAVGPTITSTPAQPNCP